MKHDFYIPKHVSQKRHSAWFGHIPFAHEFIRLIRPNIFVELGTHNGGSYFSFCDSVKTYNLPTSCYAIDTWEGEEHAGRYGESVFEFVQKYNDNNFKPFSNLIRKRFEVVLQQFEDNSIDLIHIDGFHSYEAVLNDYETWKPKMDNNGVMLFHDTCVERKGYGVKKFWSELESQYPSQCYNFHHSHGLGVFSLNASTQVNDLLGFEAGQESLLRAHYEARAKKLRRIFKLVPKFVRNFF